MTNDKALAFNDKYAAIGLLFSVFMSAAGAYYGHIQVDMWGALGVINISFVNLFIAYIYRSSYIIEAQSYKRAFDMAQSFADTTGFLEQENKVLKAQNAYLERKLKTCKNVVDMRA